MVYTTLKIKKKSHLQFYALYYMHLKFTARVQSYSRINIIVQLAE